MVNEIYDGNIVLKVRGQEQRTFVSPSTREILAIIDTVQEYIRKGAVIDHFEMRRDIQLM